MSKEGTMRFGVYGIKDNQRLVTERISYNVVRGAYTNAEESEPPIAPTWEEVIKIIENFKKDTIEYQKSNFIEMKKIKDYLYEIWYQGIDYDYASKYFEENGAVDIGACSSIRNGNFYGRNFDWLYDNKVSFIVHTPKIANRYSSIGVTGTVPEMTNEFVESREQSLIYKLVPFFLVDGINEHGLVVNTNVVPASNESNIGIPSGTSDITLNNMMVIRYILDNFSSAAEAVNYITNHVTIYPHKPLSDMHYDLHWMIADEDDTYLIEIIDGEIVATDISDKPYMTNFHITGVNFNSDGTVYTPYTQDSTHNAVDTNLIEELGSGLERYNLLVNGYDNANTKAGMRSLMDTIKYTNAYTITAPEDVWYTEFVGVNDMTVKTPYIDYADTLSAARNLYEERTRTNPQTWQTVHSSVYDIHDKKLYIVIQEDNSEIEYGLDAYFSVAIDDDKTTQDNTWSAFKINNELSGKQDTISDLSSIRLGAALGATALQDYTETDPTVPTWAKQESKPSYTAEEVGALPDTTNIPLALSDLSDDSTHRTVTDAEKSTWNAKQSEISDLDTIRSGAEAGSTAIQNVNGKSGKSISLTADDIGINVVSPTITITNIENGHRVTITDENGDHVFDVANGSDGINGIDGVNGIDGDDGVSPSVSTSTISGGTRVTITDADGAHNFDVMNGQNGTDGTNGTNGADGADGKPGTVVSSTQPDYDAVWVNPSSAETVQVAEMSDIPTKTSDLTNDSGFLTQHQSLSAYRTASAQDVIDGAIQSQIDALVSKSDVVDVVGTYAELQAYDTTALLNNDVVKVLSDSTHSDSRSYYRWVVADDTGEWEYVGSESVGYTKTETDAAIAAAIGNAIGGEY